MVSANWRGCDVGGAMTAKPAGPMNLAMFEQP